MNSLLKVIVVAVFCQILHGCATILDNDREFSEPMTGTIMVVRDVFSNDEENIGCQSKAKSARIACEKELEELKQSFERAKQ